MAANRLPASSSAPCSRAHFSTHQSISAFDSHSCPGAETHLTNERKWRLPEGKVTYAGPAAGRTCTTAPAISDTTHTQPPP